LPMALGLGDGAELRTPMAVTVISGLLISTLLTLFIIPSIYAQVSRLRGRLMGEEVFEIQPGRPVVGDVAAADAASLESG